MSSTKRGEDGGERIVCCPRCLTGSDGGECRKIEMVLGHRCRDEQRPCVRCGEAQLVEVRAESTGLVSVTLPCLCAKGVARAKTT